LEVQILEGDAQILQRNTIIDFLQEQVHDLNQELGDTLGHIKMLQEQQMPPLVPNELEEEEEDSEEEPVEIEGVSEIDSEHGDPEANPQPDHSSSSSQSSVGNLDDF
jgi:hypothetical protein